MEWAARHSSVVPKEWQWITWATSMLRTPSIARSGRLLRLGGNDAGRSGWNMGRADGTGNAARFMNPHSVAVDSAGNVYVADSYNNAIRKIAPTGVVTTLAVEMEAVPMDRKCGAVQLSLWRGGGQRGQRLCSRL